MGCSEWGQSASFIEEFNVSLYSIQNELNFTQMPFYFASSIASHGIPSGIEAPRIRLCSKIRGY